MKIGIFDSGLGGLIVARAIRKAMPQYDYVYLGDTKRVPYGSRSHQAVYEFTREGVEYFLKKENCAFIILACNTASARALKRLQNEYFYKNFPNMREGKNQRKVLGVLIPAAEECRDSKKVGVLATLGTVASQTFPKEIRKINKKVKIFQNAAPMLVPLAEEGEKFLAKGFLEQYLKPLIAKKIDHLVLGCTHYPIFKNEIRKLLPKNIKVISQDEIIPKKLKEYLNKHPEIKNKLSKKGTAKILVTDRTQTIDSLTKKWFGKDTKPKLIKL